MDLCLAIYIYFSCQRSPNGNQVILEPVGTWGVDRRGSRSSSKAPVSRGRLTSTRRQRLASRTQCVLESPGRRSVLCVPAFVAFVFMSLSRAPGWILLEQPRLFPRPGFLLHTPSSLVTFAWLCYQIVGVVEEVPFPESAQRLRPAPRSCPAHQHVPGSLALPELRGAFPGTLLLLGPGGGGGRGQVLGLERVWTGLGALK